MPTDPHSTQAHFAAEYAGEPPWEIGRPQPPFRTIANQVKSPVLDAGCGTGATALFLASQGHRVTGIDFVEEAIRRARYVAGLRHVLEPGGRLYLFGFSNEEPAAPRGGLSLQDLETSFAEGWEIESIQSVRGELNPAFVAQNPDKFPKEGPRMRFAIIRCS